MSDALIVVDAQYDFIWGSMGAPGREAILPNIYKTATGYKLFGGLVVASLDWHTRDHCSFQAQGGPFPVHCVQYTFGAGIPEPLARLVDQFVLKGVVLDRDAMSAFNGTRLNERLRFQGVKSVAICGYCTDFCVLATALDSLRFGFRTSVLTSLCCGVEQAACKTALAQLENAGARLL